MSSAIVERSSAQDCRSTSMAIGEPGWDRTIDPLIKSQMLCH
jgi:hypothetical protein